MYKAQNAQNVTITITILRLLGFGFGRKSQISTLIIPNKEQENWETYRTYPYLKYYESCGQRLDHPRMWD
jgi:hypothetical protein